MAEIEPRVSLDVFLARGRPEGDRHDRLVALATALGCGLIAGVFFAFSTFVMKALGSLLPAQGIAAMQSINLAVLNPWCILFNVPRNNALALIGPSDTAAPGLWRSYLSTWTAWNHVRMLAAFAASAALMLGLHCRSSRENPTQ
jgi:uncharacterized membrane protein